MGSSDKTFFLVLASFCGGGVIAAFVLFFLFFAKPTVVVAPEDGNPGNNGGDLRHDNAIPKGRACTQEAKICPDGTAVGRIGPNCEFAQCPGEDVFKDSVKELN